MFRVHTPQGWMQHPAQLDIHAGNEHVWTTSPLLVQPTLFGISLKVPIFNLSCCALVVGSHNLGPQEKTPYLFCRAACRNCMFSMSHATCSSSQILARALGGSVGKNPDGKFVLTLEQIQPTPQLQQFSDLQQVVQQALTQACRTDSEAAAGNDSVARALHSAEAAAGTAGVDGLVDGLHEMQLACDSGCFRLIESHGDQVTLRCQHPQRMQETVQRLKLCIMLSQHKRGSCPTACTP